MRCYATQLGNCKGGITKEHYVSRSVLEIAGREIQITGFPWQQHNESANVGINSLVSKVLCRHHNSELSHLDASGREFLRALKTSFDSAVSKDEFTHEVFNVAGDKIELWLLKILCGVLAVSKNVTVPEKWVEILFEREPIADGSGLHIFGEMGSSRSESGRSSVWFFNLVRVSTVLDKNRRIAGAKFGIGGLAFLLAFGKVTFHDPTIQSIYRPGKISIERDAETKVINFSWGRYTGGGSVELMIAGPADAGDSKAKPIVEPWRKN